MATDPPTWLQQARDQWKHRGRDRPPFAEEPGPDQESVWDYPRPPAVVPDSSATKGPAARASHNMGLAIQREACSG